MSDNPQPPSTPGNKPATSMQRLLAYALMIVVGILTWLATMALLAYLFGAKEDGP
jgi:hypothetical protein